MIAEDLTRRSDTDNPEAEVISANIDFYREIAGKYDEYESCVQSEQLQEMLRADIVRMGTLLGPRNRKVHCLDCGGGSGNLSLKMLEMGWDVTVVDVSSNMLLLLEGRAQKSGFHPVLVNSSIEAFLESSTDQYDIVSFNSVLHHLYSYLEIINRATDRIHPDGLFYSNFDPVIPRGFFLPKLFESADTILAKAFHDRSDFFPGITRRVRKAFRRSNGVHQRAVASAGDLAEYHARSGVDDQKIIALLKNKDFSILDHARWAGGRTWLARMINRRARFLETFKILARKS